MIYYKFDEKLSRKGPIAFERYDNCYYEPERISTTIVVVLGILNILGTLLPLNHFFEIFFGSAAMIGLLFSLGILTATIYNTIIVVFNSPQNLRIGDVEVIEMYSAYLKKVYIKDDYVGYFLDLSILFITMYFVKTQYYYLSLLPTVAVLSHITVRTLARARAIGNFRIVWVGVFPDSFYYWLLLFNNYMFNQEVLYAFI